MRKATTGKVKAVFSTEAQEWLRSPQGQEEIIKALKTGLHEVETLHKARRVSEKSLRQRITL